MSFFKNLLGSGSNEFTKVENDQRFNDDGMEAVL